MKKTLLVALLLVLSIGSICAQSSMTDDQVIKFVIKEQKAGSSQQQIVTKLVQKGVDIDQIRRVRKKYERMNKGDGLGTVKDKSMTEDERYLFGLRDQWLSSIREEGPRARLLETLIYRHLPDALYDGRLEERIDFIRRAYAEIADGWTDGDLPALIERARAFSDRVEYDDEVLEDWIDGGGP